MARLFLIGVMALFVAGCTTTKQDCSSGDGGLLNSCDNKDEPTVAEGKVDPYGDLSNAYVN